MSESRERAIAALVVFNVLLQIFDGVATYLGVTAGFGEANPLVARAMSTVGTGPALWIFKLQACALLLLVWQLRARSRIAVPALVVTAMLYLAGSIGPWSAALAPLYFAIS